METSKSNRPPELPTPNKPSPEQLLTDWYRRARESQFSHYTAADYYTRLNLWLGVPVVCFSTVVGTTVFATLEQEVDILLRILVGSISVIAAVLASLQTFLRFSERVEKHKSTAAAYGAIRREIEQMQAISVSLDGEENDITSIRDRLDGLAAEAPEIPQRVWKKALENL